MTIFERLARAYEAVALATRLDDAHPGAKMIVWEDGVDGNLGSFSLNRAVEAEARTQLALGETAIRTFGPDGEPIGVEARVFIQAFAPKPDMYIFGAIDFSRAMATLGKYLGYRVTVVDARPIFATRRASPTPTRLSSRGPMSFFRARASTNVPR